MRFAAHDPGRTPLYADETVEPRLVEFLCCSAMRIESAEALGLVQRAPRAHLDEARRRRRILLTRDHRFLDHEAFPFEELRSTGIVVITAATVGPTISGVVCALITTIGRSGAKALRGQIELRGERLVRRAMIAGHLRTEILLAGSALVATTAVAESSAIAAAAASARR